MTTENRNRFYEALSHEHTCPCELCKEFWGLVDPDGDYIRDERDESTKPSS